MNYEEGLVSICIPVYNGKDYIEQAVKSALNQTYTKVEIVICDNASTDNTQEILTSFEDERLKVYINTTNIGFASNLNKCIKMSQGEYVKFLCADDVLEEDCIEKLVDFIEKYPEVKIISCNYNIINASNCICPIVSDLSTKSHLYKKGKESIKKILLDKNKLAITPSCLFIKNTGENDKFIEVNNSSYSSDLEYVCRQLMNSDVLYVSDRLVKYRKHSNQLTNKELTECIDRFRIPLEFRDYIINQNGLHLNENEWFKIKFEIFQHGLNLHLKEKNVISLKLIRYLLEKFGMQYFLYIPIYVIKIVLKKIITRLRYIFR